MILPLENLLTTEELQIVNKLAGEVKNFTPESLESCMYSLLLLVKDENKAAELRHTLTPILQKLGLRLFIYNMAYFHFVESDKSSVVRFNKSHAIAIFDGDFKHKCEKRKNLHLQKEKSKQICECYNCILIRGYLEQMQKQQESGGMDFGQFLVIHALYETNLLVPSLAGSGKSTVSVERIIFLRVTGAITSLDAVAFITHTNASTDDVRKKVRHVIRTFDAGTKQALYDTMLLEYQSMKIMTISKFAEFAIGFAGRTVGMTAHESPQNIENEFKKLISEQLSRELVATSQVWPQTVLYKRCIEYKKLADSRGLQLHDIQFPKIMDEQETIIYKVLTSVSKKMEQQLLSKRQFTLTTIFEEAEKIVNSKDGSILLSGVIQYVVLDEYQDASNKMLAFILSFTKKKCIEIASRSLELAGVPLLIVGQKSQSIYRFIGGQAHSLEEIKGRLNLFEEIRIRHNYRMVNVLADKIYPVLVKGAKGLKPDLTHPISVRKSSKPLSEHLIKETQNFSIDYLRQLLHKCGPGQSVSIICNVNKDVEVIKQKIRKDIAKNGPIHGYKLADSAQLYKTRAAVILSVILKNLLYDNAVPLPFEINEELKQKFNIKELLINLKGVHQSDVVYTLLKIVVQMESLQSVLPEILNILNDALVNCNQRNSVLAVERWLEQQMQRVTGADENEIPKAQPDEICVNTIHKMKGLEFDIVILPNLSKKIIRPDAAFITESREFVAKEKDDLEAAKREDKLHLEEQERLLYVAVTRAIDRLVLMDVNKTKYNSFANYLIDGDI